jgi:hypothetical protein
LNTDPQAARHTLQQLAKHMPIPEGVEHESLQILTAIVATAENPLDVVMSMAVGMLDVLQQVYVDTMLGGVAPADLNNLPEPNAECNAAAVIAIQRACSALGIVAATAVVEVAPEPDRHRSNTYI